MPPLPAAFYPEVTFLKDLTLGKYIAVASPLHNLDPRTKFIAVLLLMSTLLAAEGLAPGERTHLFAPLLFFAIFLAAIVPLARIPIGIVIKNLRPFIWLFFFTLVLWALWPPPPPYTVLWHLPAVDLFITLEGVKNGLFFSLRLSLIIVTASLLTLTTAPIELTAGLEKLFNPLRRIGFPVHELAMMISIAMRFVPVLVEEAERLYKAQLARGANFSGGPIQRAKNLIPLLVPLFISTFARADRLALAMESRCYRGGINRTYFRELKFAQGDFYTALAVLAIIAVLLTLPFLVPF
ncbi:MAG: transporter [Gemmatimonadetes bacterium]|nr:transporter [Gemmatimonadota bacterium]